MPAVTATVTAFWTARRLKQGILRVMMATGTEKGIHPVHAAYAASQPLFDVLRTGCASTEDQNASLSRSRDCVQRLHVQLPEQGSEDGLDQFAVSIYCAVKAWRTAAKAYADIFASYATATASEVAAGRSARHPHADLAQLASSAASACKVANDIIAVKQAVKRDQKSVEDGVGQSIEENGVEESGDEESSVEENEEYNYVASILERSNSRDKGSNVRARRRRRRKHRAMERATKDPDDSREPILQELDDQSGPTVIPGLKNDDHIVPRLVEYEDISGEVEARLKAKEERRSRKKAEEKRKRESGGSVDAAELDGKENRPARKKAKSEDRNTLPPQERLKKHQREGEDAMEGEGRRMRKRPKV